MLSIPFFRNALALGLIGLLALVLARARRAELWLPIYIVAAAGVAMGLRALHPAFMVESLINDPPWLAAAALAGWAALAATGLVRARSWWAVVVASAVLGDLLVATGLALCEPDDKRRAKLVLAASGASLLGPASGAAALALGWGGLPLAALGLGLAALGFARGGERPVLQAEYTARGLLGAALVPLWLALVTWLFMLGGVPDLGANVVENLPLTLPGRAPVAVAAVAALLGGLGAEAGVALLAGDLLGHATQLRGDWAPDALRIGVAVGGGLPMLILTRSRLTVGIPLWVAQVLLALGFVAWRY
ncbi:MAG: hypothetical protein FJ090_08415 [Deltaproteobacteria bacterium]|nr:hypothetical protein [Deltaproteobacteria bacterium]